MKYNEAEKVLEQYQYAEDLNDEQYEIISELSNHKDSYIRMTVAELLINFETAFSERILLKLANDDIPIVRMCAYDSLSVFTSKEVISILSDAILSEEDEIARSLAIYSLTDIVVKSGKEKSFTEFFSEQYQKEKSDYCILAYYFAFYKFGSADYIYNILDYLDNHDYHIRCAVLNNLSEITNDDNKDMILLRVKDRLTTENSQAVLASLKEFIDSHK